MASPSERLDPVSGHALAAVAGGLLFGRALVVGIGSFVSGYVAKRNSAVRFLVGVDNNLAAVEAATADGFAVECADIRDFEFGYQEWDSIFFNVFPVQRDMAGLALPIVASLNPSGRLITTPSVQVPMVWPTEVLTIEQDIHVCPSEPFSPCLRTYRARPWPSG